MAEYPIILIPASLDRKRVQARVPTSPQEPAKPVEPIRPTYRIDEDVKYDIGCFGIFLVVYTIVVALVSKSNFILVGILPAVGLLIVISLFKSVPSLLEHGSDMSNYRRRLSDYEKSLRSYPTEQVAYQKAQAEYAAALERHHRLLRFGAEQHEYVRKALLQTDNKLLFDSTIEPVMGRCEGLLFAGLHAAFGQKVRQDVCVPLRNARASRDFKLRPDITYHDGASRLTIAIEVDEPYVQATGEPIHYSGSDDERNAQFLALGWLVVRFSERQVVLHLAECIELIMSVATNLCEIQQLVDAHDLTRRFPELGRERQWTSEEARSMAFNGYRKSYLN